MKFKAIDVNTGEEIIGTGISEINDYDSYEDFKNQERRVVYLFTRGLEWRDAWDFYCPGIFHFVYEDTVEIIK